MYGAVLSRNLTWRRKVTVVAQACALRCSTGNSIRSASMSSKVIIDNGDIHVVQRPVGPFQMNQYLIGCKTTKEAALIDSGEDPFNFFEAYANKGSFRIEHLIQTHAHIDHVGGLKPTKQKYPNAPIYLHESDLPVYNSVVQTAAMYGLSLEVPLPPVDKFIQEGDTISIGNIKLNVMFTPGHCPGHCIFLYEHPTDPFAFVGDLIFRCSVGRTDLPLCDPLLMKTSIRRIVSELPRKTLLLPGHMTTTTMEEEIEHNPFVQEWTR